MIENKPRILFVFAKRAAETSTRFGGFVERIQKNGGLSYATADYVALEDLILEVKGPKYARVFDPRTGINLNDYDFVYFKSWQSMAGIAASAALFLEAKGIPYADEQVKSNIVGKTATYMKLWGAGVSVPASVWGSKSALRHYVESLHSDYPVIIKAVNGQKGQDNFLVKNRKDALQIIEQAETEMVIQEFIPNEGDYRIGVYGNRARWGIFRRSGGKSHLNNTSAGASAELLDIETVDSNVLDLAERAAMVAGLAISGVDVIEHKTTKALFILEANQGSQIVTGVDTESNMKAFDEGIKDLVHRRYVRKSNRPLQVIGRHTAVTIEGLDEPVKVLAKVDTGAYRSSLHVESVDLIEEDTPFIRYTIKDPLNGTLHIRETSEFRRAKIKNSFGIKQVRFVVGMRLRINGVQYKTSVSLADRSTQKYPLLIGRKLLLGNFIVNVELGK